MYWLHTDETGTDVQHSEFFIYGGLVSTPEQLETAHSRVIDIRTRFGFEPGDSFKCNTHTRPKKMPISDWTAAKSAAIDLAVDLKLTMMVTAVHHQIYQNQDDKTRAVWSLENLTRHFANTFLEEHNALGAICIDRMPEKFAFDQIETMLQGKIDWNGNEVGIPRIIHYSFTSDKASHFNSLVDICLGTLRLCFQAAFDGKDRTTEIAEEVFPKLYRILHKDPNSNHALGSGLYLLPLNVKSPAIKAKYDTLNGFLCVRTEPQKLIQNPQRP